jgi:hypothetical protein
MRQAPAPKSPGYRHTGKKCGDLRTSSVPILESGSACLAARPDSEGSTAVVRHCMRAAGGLSAYRGHPARIARWILIMVVACPGAALAQLDFPLNPPQTHFTPYADAAYEHNSNLFALSNLEPEVVGRNGPTLADTLFKVRAGFDLAYDWSRQEFFAIAEGRRFDYHNFNQLNHNEYLLHGGLKWKIASVLDGIVDYQRERSMVSFLQYNETQFASTQIFLQVQSIATASINLQVTPEWRLESLGKLNDLKSPRPGFLDLDLREDSIHEGLRYVGFANLSAGLDGEYLNGHFNNGNFLLTPNYHQTTEALAADYSLSGLSVFHGAIGYTSRTQQQAGTVSGLTGLVAYQRDLTGKTSINLKLSRAINTYLTSAAPEVDTTAELDVTWHATEKIKVEAGYQYLHSSYSATDVAGVVTASRVDHMQTPTLSVKYQPLNWLLVRPYIQYQSRTSSLAIYTFNGTVYGIELEGRLPLQ